MDAMFGHMTSVNVVRSGVTVTRRRMVSGLVERVRGPADVLLSICMWKEV